MQNYVALAEKRAGEKLVEGNEGCGFLTAKRDQVAHVSVEHKQGERPRVVLLGEFARPRRKAIEIFPERCCGRRYIRGHLGFDISGSTSVRHPQTVGAR